MEEWKEYKLGEIGTIVGGATPSTKDPVNYDGDIAWITPKDLSGHTGMFIRRGERMISQIGFDSCSCKMLPKGSVLFSSRAPIGYVAIAEYELCTNQGFKSVIPNSDLTNNIFLYYLLVYNKDYIEGLGSGTTFKEVSGQTMKNVDVKIPSLQTQNKIASILKSLDDKIEVNRKINENLEEQAQALFKSWFVDFEPFKNGEFVESELGMIPQGWRVVSLADLMDYSGGSQPPASEFIDEECEGYIRFIQIRDYASDSHVTYIPISKKNKLCDVRDIMIARYGASLGRICYGLKGAYNVALAKVYPTKNHYLELLRCYLNTREFYEGINQKGNRAVQAGFNKSDIQSFLLPIPNNEDIIVKFNELCSSMFDSRLSNDIESRRLAELRDTLLPKLMSGELKVNEIA